MAVCSPSSARSQFNETRVIGGNLETPPKLVGGLSLLEVFADAVVVGNDPTKLEQFLYLLTIRLHSPWERDTDVEERLKGGNPTSVFCKKGPAAQSSVKLFLMRDGDRLKITNIVPQGVKSLTRTQYNEIVGEFYRNYMQPVAEELGLHSQMSSTNRDIGDWLSPRAKNALQAFSSSANKGTGSGHPSDLQRWNTFIILAHLDRATLPDQTLQRWLIEEQRFPEEVAIDLASEYSFGRDILSSYDAYRS